MRMISIKSMRGKISFSSEYATVGIGSVLFTNDMKGNCTSGEKWDNIQRWPLVGQLNSDSFCRRNHLGALTRHQMDESIITIQKQSNLFGANQTS